MRYSLKWYTRLEWDAKLNGEVPYLQKKTFSSVLLPLLKGEQNSSSDTNQSMLPFLQIQASKTMKQKFLKVLTEALAIRGKNSILYLQELMHQNMAASIFDFATQKWLYVLCTLTVIPILWLSKSNSILSFIRGGALGITLSSGALF